MNSVLHRANTRGHANHGWLDSYHTFSFAQHYDPQRMNFGMLRVLNDDVVAGGKGFGTHPHDNMEIISIPLKGDLEHKDSMGTVTTIRRNDVQIMSAGTGVYHSEYNKNSDELVNFLQIWIFPKQRDIQPRYDQKSFDPEKRINSFQTIVSPVPGDGGVIINQDAWLSLGKFDKGFQIDYKIKLPGNGVYCFIIEGNINVNGQQLSKRDGLGVINDGVLNITADSASEILLIDVPMN